MAYCSRHALFVRSCGLAVDPAANIYIADSGNQRVRRISPDGVISTVTAGGPDIAAGSAGSIYFTDSGNIRKVLTDGTIADVTQGEGPIALDSAGNLYVPVSTFPGYGIRKISPVGVVTTAPNVSSGLPVALAVDSNGNVYVAAYAPFSSLADGRVHKVSPIGVVTIIAGTQTAGYSGDGGPVTRALLNPSALAIDSSGNIFVMDSVNDVIRMLRPSGP